VTVGATGVVLAVVIDVVVVVVVVVDVVVVDVVVGVVVVVGGDDAANSTSKRLSKDEAVPRATSSNATVLCTGVGLAPITTWAEKFPSRQPAVGL
jgi:hypothetical protein